MPGTATTTPKRGLVSYGPYKTGGWKLQNLTLRPLQQRELLVEIVASGICQTDLHLAGPESGFGVHYPRVMGHEGIPPTPRVLETKANEAQGLGMFGTSDPGHKELNQVMLLFCPFRHVRVVSRVIGGIRRIASILTRLILKLFLRTTRLRKSNPTRQMGMISTGNFSGNRVFLVGRLSGRTLLSMSRIQCTHVRNCSCFRH